MMSVFLGQCIVHGVVLRLIGKQQYTRNWVVSKQNSRCRWSNPLAAFVKGDSNSNGHGDDSGQDADHDGGAKLIPLRTVESGALNVLVWIEESKTKMKLWA
jgi:hypothetical protein